MNLRIYESENIYTYIYYSYLPIFLLAENESIGHFSATYYRSILGVLAKEKSFFSSIVIRITGKLRKKVFPSGSRKNKSLIRPRRKISHQLSFCQLIQTKRIRRGQRTRKRLWEKIITKPTSNRKRSLLFISQGIKSRNLGCSASGIKTS